MLCFLLYAQKRAKAALAAGQSRGITASELTARLGHTRNARLTLPTDSSTSPVVLGRGSDDGMETGDDEGLMVVGRDDDNWLSPIAECREVSASVLLHFPHIELLFLVFAFEGAMTAQIGAIRHATCPQVFCTAVIVLVRTNVCKRTVKLLQGLRSMIEHTARPFKL